MLDRLDFWASGHTAEPLRFAAAENAKQALDQLARTEDIRIAPGAKRLAIAGYHKDSVTVFDIDFEATHAAHDSEANAPALTLNSHFTIAHPSLKEPHGLDFIDAKTLVVGNRAGGVSILALPDGTPTNGRFEAHTARLLRRMNLSEKIHHPGSVCVASHPGETPVLLVANNYNQRITRHAVFDFGPLKVARHKIFIADQLDVPDGITVTPDKSVFAVSNHMTHEVLLWRNDESTKPDTPPFARLAGTIYPHGLRFTPDGEKLVVASAGTPTVSVYARPPGGWTDVETPDFVATVIGNDDFHRGHTNPAEGGPKGLDIDPTGQIVLITNEEVALQAFWLNDLLKPTR